MPEIKSMPVDRDCGPDVERRGIARKIEVRKEGDNRYAEGYAAVFFDPADTVNTQFELWDDCFERIMPGAFDNVLSRPDDVRCLFNHEPDRIYGRTAAGTLKLSVDKIGLRFSCSLPNSPDADSLIESINRGDISGCSFGFTTRGGSVNWRDVGEQTFRELLDVKVYDVGPCTFPAYGGTSCEIAQRSLTAHREASKRTAQQSINAVRRRLRLSRLAD